MEIYSRFSQLAGVPAILDERQANLSNDLDGQYGNGYDDR